MCSLIDEVRFIRGDVLDTSTELMNKNGNSNDVGVEGVDSFRSREAVGCFSRGIQLEIRLATMQLFERPELCFLPLFGTKTRTLRCCQHYVDLKHYSGIMRDNRVVGLVIKRGLGVAAEHVTCTGINRLGLLENGCLVLTTVDEDLRPLKGTWVNCLVIYLFQFIIVFERLPIVQYCSDICECTGIHSVHKGSRQYHIDSGRCFLAPICRAGLTGCSGKLNLEEGVDGPLRLLLKSITGGKSKRRTRTYQRHTRAC